MVPVTNLRICEVCSKQYDASKEGGLRKSLLLCGKCVKELAKLSIEEFRAYEKTSE